MGRVLGMVLRHPMVVLGSLLALWYGAVRALPQVKARKAARRRPHRPLGQP